MPRFEPHSVLRKVPAIHIDGHGQVTKRHQPLHALVPARKDLSRDGGLVKGCAGAGLVQALILVLKGGGNMLEGVVEVEVVVGPVWGKLINVVLSLSVEGVKGM